MEGGGPVRCVREVWRMYGERCVWKWGRKCGFISHFTLAQRFTGNQIAKIFQQRKEKEAYKDFEETEVCLLYSSHKSVFVYCSLCGNTVENITCQQFCSVTSAGSICQH